MYYTGAAMGENRSGEQKVKATTQTKALTPTQKIALVWNESPHLRQSKPTAVIRIESEID
jgi:hypothetical protein